MVDSSQLPHLLRLVDDPSPTVRRGVAEALASFGDELGTALQELDPPPPAQSVEAALNAARGLLEPASDEPAAEPQDVFEVGQLVKHQRYGYRGIVVAVDPSCRASESWYSGNTTQPTREQPWYHVLVHDSEQVTYAAQTNLCADASGGSVKHPLVGHFFDEVGDGLYLRNSRAWPGWESESA